MHKCIMLIDQCSHNKLEAFVSIIIVNYNGKPDLDKCLNSLTTIFYSNFEVLVVDNSSTDGSVNLVKQKYAEMKLIELKQNLGFAAANNLAAKKAKGDFYVFLNNDTVVTETWLSELVRSLTGNDKGVVIAQSLLLLDDGNIDSSGDYIDKFGRPYSSKLKDPPNGRAILSARAASMIIRKEAFWRLGGFEEDFFASFEDVHLGWKAWIAGYKVILASNSIVYHFAGQTVKKLKNEINFHSMKNQACIILLDFEFPLGIKKILSLLPLYMSSVKITKKAEERKGETMAAVYSNPLLLSDVIKTFFWICRHALILHKKYKVINQMRVRSTNYLVDMGLMTSSKHEK